MELSESELKEIKKLALNYGDPLRGKMLALIAHVELLKEENNELQAKKLHQ